MSVCHRPTTRSRRQPRRCPRRCAHWCTSPRSCCRAASRCWAKRKRMRGAKSSPTSAARWGRIPRVYIECTADQAISISAQRAMHSQLPCSKVVTLDTSHSPFLSAPDAVAGHLLALQGK
ncbi:MAG: alpha/beta fold hydrolase [Steroidobacteraceae bacterium]